MSNWILFKRYRTLRSYWLQHMPWWICLWYVGIIWCFNKEMPSRILLSRWSIGNRNSFFLPNCQFLSWTLYLTSNVPSWKISRSNRLKRMQNMPNWFLLPIWLKCRCGSWRRIYCGYYWHGSPSSMPTQNLQDLWSKYSVHRLPSWLLLWWVRIVGVTKSAWYEKMSRGFLLPRQDRWLLSEYVPAWLLLPSWQLDTDEMWCWKVLRWVSAEWAQGKLRGWILLQTRCFKAKSRWWECHWIAVRQRLLLFSWSKFLDSLSSR